MAGVIAALVAGALILLARLVTDSLAGTHGESPLVFAAPVLAGTVAGLVRYRFAAGATGLETIATGRSPGLGLALRTAGLAIATAGLGGFVGREEPAIGLASAVTSRIGVLQRAISPRGLLAATIAGGVGATFGAPFAALAFALEAVAGRFAATDLLAIAVASFSGALLGQGTGQTVVLPVGVAPEDLNGWIGLGAVAVLGLVVSLGVSSLFGVVGDLTRRFPIATIAAPIAGGVLVGVLLIVVPGVADPISPVILTDPSLSSLVVAFGKILGVTALLATGGAGGLLLPITGIGIAGGAGLTALIQPFAGSLTATTIALVFVVALFAGSFRTPLAAIALAAEAGGDASLLAPLAIVCWIGAAICRRADPLTVLTVIRAEPPAAPVTDSERQLATLRVGDVMETTYPSVTASASIDSVRRLSQAVPVLDRSGRLIGVAGPDDADRALLDGQHHLSAAGFARRHGPVAYPYQTVAEAFDQPGSELVTMLPVVNPRQPRQLVGVLRRSTALAAAGIAPSEAPDVLAPFHIAVGDEWSGHLLRDCKLPRDAFAAAIERDGNRIPALPETELCAGDRILGLALPAVRSEVEARLRGAPTP